MLINLNLDLNKSEDTSNQNLSNKPNYHVLIKYSMDLMIHEVDQLNAINLLKIKFNKSHKFIHFLSIQFLNVILILDYILNLALKKSIPIINIYCVWG